MGDVVEHRAPAAALVPLQFVGANRAQSPQWDAKTAVTDGFMASPEVHRCISVIADAAAGLPIRAGAETPSNPSDPGDSDPTCRLAQLLGPPPGGPAPFRSARALIKYIVAQLIVTGRFGIEVETTRAAGKGDVVALWELVSNQIRPIPAKSGSRPWKGFEVGPNDSRMVKLSVDSVIYHWRPSLLDPREPTSPLQAAAAAISSAVAADTHTYSFLKNRAMPASLILTHEFSPDGGEEAFRRQWESMFGGPGNSGRNFFMSSDGDEDLKSTVEVINLGASHKDAQLTELREQMRDIICLALGVPLSMAGDASGRTYANADAEERQFWAVTMRPILAEIQDVFNAQLAPRLGTEVCWFDLSSIEALKTRPDPVTASVGAPTLVLNRLMTINEARADYGLPAIDGGDRVMTVDEIAALQGASAAPAAISSTRARRESRALPLEQGERLAVDTEEGRARLWRTAESAYTQYEKLWVRQLRRHFTKQRNAALSRLTGNARSKALRAASGTKAWTEDRAPADGLFDPGYWADEAQADLRTLYEAVATGSIGRVADQFGLSFDLEAQFVDDFIRARASDLAGQITNTTYAQLNDELVEGVSAGESIDQLAKRIESVFDEADDSRAVTIARTEVVSATNGAAVEAVKHLGGDVVGGMEWLAARDSRTRDTHLSADGQVRIVGQPFTVGGVQMAYPGDPAAEASETVGCRCAVVFLTPEEMTG